MRHRFQPDYGADKRGDKENSPEGGRFLEYKNSHQDRADGSNACPNGISGSDGQSLGSFDQQNHADNQ